MEVTYAGGEVYKFVGELATYGSWEECELAHNEYIKEVTLEQGYTTYTNVLIISSMVLRTDKKICGPYGQDGGSEPMTITGNRLLYIGGRMHVNRMRGITLYFDYDCKTQ